MRDRRIAHAAALSLFSAEFKPFAIMEWAIRKLTDQSLNLSRQRIFIASENHFVALCPSPLPQQPAGMPLRDSVALACMPVRATPPLRA
jgi:hypothetical protein